MRASISFATASCITIKAFLVIRCQMVALLGLHLVFLCMSIRIDVGIIRFTFRHVVALLVDPGVRSLLFLVGMSVAWSRLHHCASFDAGILFQIHFLEFSIC